MPSKLTKKEQIESKYNLSTKLSNHVNQERFFLDELTAKD